MTEIITTESLEALLKKRTKPRRTEHNHQVAVFQWAWMARQKYPELSMLVAIPNGGARDIRTGASMKREGVKRGFPDMMLCVSRNGYHGLFIELKASGGKLKPEQLEWHARLRNQGYAVVVAVGSDNAIRCIENYLRAE